MLVSLCVDAVKPVLRGTKSDNCGRNASVYHVRGISFKSLVVHIGFVFGSWVVITSLPVSLIFFSPSSHRFIPNTSGDGTLTPWSTALLQSFTLTDAKLPICSMERSVQHPWLDRWTFCFYWPSPGIFASYLLPKMSDYRRITALR